jgi:subtilisin family serine protease
VVAAGNEGIQVGEYGPAALDAVVTVAATDLEDKRTVFSNWGPPIDIAAPGIDILSLRARRTDTMRDIPGVAYEPGAAYVGADKRYYRASGTSFSAPLVSGVASLLLSRNPALSAEQVKRILMQSARDIDTTGVDQYSGYGLVDARAALDADPDFFIESAITGVQVVQGNSGPAVRVLGTSIANERDRGVIEIGAGEEPDAWTPVAEVKDDVRNGVVGEIDANHFRGAKVWILRLVTRHKNGKTREARFRLSLG